MNALSGAIDVIDEKTAKILERSDDSWFVPIEIDGELRETLTARGYLYRSEFEEGEVLKKIAKDHDEKAHKIPGRFIFIVTYACNLRCSYCFQGEFMRNNRIMTSSMVDKAFDAISEVSERNGGSVPEICLFGGEPLMATRHQKEIVKKILEDCESKHYPVRVITNGVELEYFLDLITRFDVKNLQVTLDGPKEVHDRRRMFSNGKGSFCKIVRGIDLALRNNLRIELHVNVDSDNIRYLPDLADFIVKKGWLETGQFTPYITTVKNFGCGDYRSCITECELLSELYKMLVNKTQLRIFVVPGGYVKLSDGQYSSSPLPGGYGINCIMSLLAHGKIPPPRIKNCGAQINSFAFDPCGYVYTCGQISGRKEFSVGSYYPKLALDERKLIEWRNRSVLTVRECKSCRMSLICGGGCAAAALSKSGNLYCPQCTQVEENLKFGIGLFLDDIKKVFQEIA